MTDLRALSDTTFLALMRSRAHWVWRIALPASVLMAIALVLMPQGAQPAVRTLCAIAWFVLAPLAWWRWLRPLDAEARRRWPALVPRGTEPHEEL